MIPKDARFYREQAEKCRGLAQLTDELRRRLTDMAAEHAARAREAEDSVAGPPAGNTPPPHSDPRQSIEPLTLSIKDASRVLGLGRSTIYRLIGDRQLETVKIGNRTLVKAASMRRLVNLQD